MVNLHINLNCLTFVIFTLYLNNQIQLVKCKNEQKYVTYTVTPGYEKYVDDQDLKSRIKDKQSRIESELQDQFKHAKTINESLKILQKNGAIVSDSGLSEGIKFQESTIGLMEAPIFLIEPPLLLPFDKFQDDEFSDNLMRKTGLSPSFKSVEESDIEKLSDPHKITDLHEAKIAKALFKQELNRLMDEKKALLERMEVLEKEMIVDGSKSAKRKFNTCSREIHELDSNIKNYLNKIEKVNRVKRSIIKREGYSSDLMDDELDIEQLEHELENQAQANPKDSKKNKQSNRKKLSENKKPNSDDEERDEDEDEKDVEDKDVEDKDVDREEEEKDDELGMEDNEEEG